jgi:hypothetical protein
MPSREWWMALSAVRTVGGGPLPGAIHCEPLKQVIHLLRGEATVGVVHHANTANADGAGLIQINSESRIPCHHRNGPKGATGSEFEVACGADIRGAFSPEMLIERDRKATSRDLPFQQETSDPV